MLDTKRQVVHGNAVFQAIGGAVDAVEPVSCEVQHGFPQGFARDGAGMQTTPLLYIALDAALIINSLLQTFYQDTMLINRGRNICSLIPLAND
jgi:hypothetical protein